MMMHTGVWYAAPGPQQHESVVDPVFVVNGTTGEVLSSPVAMRHFIETTQEALDGRYPGQNPMVESGYLTWPRTDPDEEVKRAEARDRALAQLGFSVFRAPSVREFPLSIHDLPAPVGLTQRDAHLLDIQTRIRNRMQQADNNSANRPYCCGY